MKQLKHVLCGCLLVAGMALGVSALSAGDSFITLSYLTNRFIPETVEQSGKRMEEQFQITYDKKKEELDQLQRGYTGTVTGAKSYSKDLQAKEWAFGDQLTLSTGSGFFLYSGTMDLEHDGAVIDVTTGEEVASGAVLTEYHRYLVAEDTSAVITVKTGTAQLGIQGSYVPKKGTDIFVPFEDVTEHDWYYHAVCYVYQQGLFSGISETQFGPGQSMDRAMLMTVLYRLAGSPQAEMDAAAQITFSDVADTAWYAPYVRWGAAQSITAGTGDGRFSPKKEVTREQVIVLLHSFATKYMGKTLDGRADLSACPDVGEASSWALDPLSWAVDAGLIGTAGGTVTLAPKRSATRAEVAAMLSTFSEKFL